MLAHQRQVRILTELRRAGAVRVSDLTDLLGVSDMTIRRDLEHLVTSGIARKVHGGAVLAGQVAHEPGLRREEPARAVREARHRRARRRR